MLLGQIQGRADVSASARRAGELRQDDGARERLDPRRHREGRGEPDHHARLTGRGNVARPAHRFRGSGGRGQDHAAQAARRLARRARPRRRDGARAGRHGRRRRDPPRAARSVVGDHAARRSAALHGVARAARRSRDPAGTRARRHRARSIASFCRPTRIRDADAASPRRRCAPPTAWRPASSYRISRC